jgi:hypothetical protein
MAAPAARQAALGKASPGAVLHGIVIIAGINGLAIAWI